MQSPRLTRRSSGILVVAGFGMALGSVAFTSRAASPSPSVMVLAPPNCAYFLKNGADVNYSIDLTSKGIPVILYRTKSYWEDVDQVKSHKKWVGAVKLLRDTTLPAFPNLTTNYRGCMEFRAARANQGSARHAELFDSAGTSLHEYKGRWLCEVAEHKPTATPDWAEYPEDCTRSFVWVKTTNKGDIPIVMPALAATKTFVIAEFKSLVESTLRLRGVGLAERQKIAQAMSTPGPWYPCAQTGCCRAFDYD